MFTRIAEREQDHMGRFGEWGSKQCQFIVKVKDCMHLCKVENLSSVNCVKQVAPV